MPIYVAYVSVQMRNAYANKRARNLPHNDGGRLEYIHTYTSVCVCLCVKICAHSKCTQTHTHGETHGARSDTLEWNMLCCVRCEISNINGALLELEQTVSACVCVCCHKGLDTHSFSKPPPTHPRILWQRTLWVFGVSAPFVLNKLSASVHGASDPSHTFSAQPVRTRPGTLCAGVFSRGKDTTHI